MTAKVYQWLANVWLILATASVAAAQTSFGGLVALEVHSFQEKPAYPGQEPRQVLPSLLLQPVVYHDWSNGRDRLTLVPMARLDSSDERRQHFDVREFNWLHIAPTWDLLIGVGKVFWGVTETSNLVNVINQTDLVEALDEEDKLGQPMVRLALNRNWGTLTFFALPYFRERTFPGEKGRLRTQFAVDTDNAQFESSLKEWHPDAAARWSQALGDWDLAVGYFRGTSREPRLMPKVGQDGVRLIPVYDQIDQASLEAQWTVEAWLWKLEAVSRWGHGEHFSAVIAGFEYTLFGLSARAFDLGLFVEHLYDDRSSVAPGTPFDNDVSVGGRLFLNDASDTAVLAGVIIDNKSREALVRIEASRRLGDHWTIELESLSLVGIPSTSPLYGIRRDGYLQVRLTRFF